MTKWTFFLCKGLINWYGVLCNSYTTFHMHILCNIQLSFFLNKVRHLLHILLIDNHEYKKHPVCIKFAPYRLVRAHLILLLISFKTLDKHNVKTSYQTIKTLNIIKQTSWNITLIKQKRYPNHLHDVTLIILYNLNVKNTNHS